MSSVDDVSRVDYLSTTAQKPVVYSTKNLATLGLSIAGTITTGSFTAEGSEDGHTWTEIPVARGNTQLSENKIIAAGSYIVGVAGYALTRLLPNTFTGQVQVSANISTRPTPAFALSGF